MPDPIDRFNVIVVATAQQASELGTQIAAFLAAPHALEHVREPSRAVILVGDTPAHQPALYLSDGALSAAKAARLDLHPTMSAEATRPRRLKGGLAALPAPLAAQVKALSAELAAHSTRTK